MKGAWGSHTLAGSVVFRYFCVRGDLEILQTPPFQFLRVLHCLCSLYPCVPGIELWSSGLCLYPQSHLASPTNFLLCHMVPTSLDTSLLHLLVISVWFTLWLYLSQTITWGRPVNLLFPSSGTREVSCVKPAGTSNPKVFSTSLVSLVKRVI